MGMHNPPHPGEFIREIYITPYELSVRRVAESLGVSPSTLNRLLNGQSNVSPEMALRLSKALGRSPESWLAMQMTSARNHLVFGVYGELVSIKGKRSLRQSCS